MVPSEIFESHWLHLFIVPKTLKLFAVIFAIYGRIRIRCGLLNIYRKTNTLLRLIVDCDL